MESNKLIMWGIGLRCDFGIKISVLVKLSDGGVLKIYWPWVRCIWNAGLDGGFFSKATFVRDHKVCCVGDMFSDDLEGALLGGERQRVAR